MSVSVALQTLIYERLVADAGVHAQVANRIYDNAPPDAIFPYVSFGPSDAVTHDADCISGVEETVQIDCWARSNARKRAVLPVVDAVRKALHRYNGTLSVGALALMEVDLVRSFMDPDGLTAHGVVQVRCRIEDAT